MSSRVETLNPEQGRVRTSTSGLWFRVRAVWKQAQGPSPPLPQPYHLVPPLPSPPLPSPSPTIGVLLDELTLAGQVWGRRPLDAIRDRGLPPGAALAGGGALPGPYLSAIIRPAFLRTSSGVFLRSHMVPTMLGLRPAAGDPGGLPGSSPPGLRAYRVGGRVAASVSACHMRMMRCV